MSLFKPIKRSVDEVRFLTSYSFIRMIMILLFGSIVNAVFIFSYGLSLDSEGNIVFTEKLWIWLVWIILYPIVWTYIATYLLPIKLRASPIDLQLTTTILLPFFYLVYMCIYDLNISWIGLTFVNGYSLLAVGFFESLIISTVIGLGQGSDPYKYDSFLLPKKQVSDFEKYYDNEKYREWLKVPNLEILVEKDEKPDKVVLSTSKKESFGLFLFLSNHKDGLLVQIISFEKGRYLIFRSEESDFVSEQLKNTICNYLKIKKIISFVDETEKGMALSIAVQITKSVSALRGLQRRDQIILTTGSIAISIILAAWYFGHFSNESAIGYVLLIIFGVIAELSYRRYKETRR